MADDQDMAVDQAEETSTSPKGGKKKIVIVAMILVVLGGGGFFGWQVMFSDKSGGNDSGAAEAKTSEEGVPKVKIMYEMDPFIVNLLGENGTRYLKAKVVAEVGNPEIEKELKDRNPEIRDALLLLLAGKSFEDISTPQGKIALRGELVARLNSVLNTGSVRMLYFTEFVVQ